MTSARKIETSRQNAHHSTGPKTAAGKARVAQNAIAHGLLSQETLLPDEDPQLLQTLADTLRTEWNPEGAHEQFLVDMMIRAAWRLHRAARMEAGVLTWQHLGLLAERAGRAARTYERGAVRAFADTYAQPTITDAEKHQAAMTHAQRLKARREESPAATLGLTFIRGSRGGDALSKLQRYEAAIERSFFRALHELQRLQHARLGGHVPPPLAIDVTVNGGAEVNPDCAAGVPAALAVDRGTTATLVAGCESSAKQSQIAD
jgi:hypothetical protein